MNEESIKKLIAQREQEVAQLLSARNATEKLHEWEKYQTQLESAKHELHLCRSLLIAMEAGKIIYED